jgi:hypothetical protein
MDFFDPKIPKREVVVKMLHSLSSQYLMKCVLFLNATSKYSANRTETLQEFLQDCGLFIPAKMIISEKKSEQKKEPVTLYNINEIIYIEEPETHIPDENIKLTNVKVTLKNKSTVTLQVNKSIMGQYSRIAEYANKSPTFLKLIKNNSYIHLNKNYIFSLN